MLDWIKNKTNKNKRQYGHFNFTLKSQPDIIDSSSTISLIAYTNSFANATLPCVYKWSIIKNGVKIERPQFKGSTYKCEPNDVGGVIQAQVKSTDMQYRGTAIVQFDPVKIDPTIKSHVQQVMSRGSFSTIVHVIKGIEERQCQIKICEQAVKIKHNYSQANFSFQYSINEPETLCLIKNSLGVVVNLKDKSLSQMKRFMGVLFEDPFKNISTSSNNMSIKVQTNNNNNIPNKDIVRNNNNEEEGLQLKFPTHAARDIFIFVMRAFAANKQLNKKSIPSSSIYMSNNNSRMSSLNQASIVVNNNSNKNIDNLLQIQSLRRQLIRMRQVLQLKDNQNIKYIEQIEKLKQQIKQIIKNYTQFIQDKFQQKTQYSNSSIIVSMDDSSLIQKKRYKNLQNQNNHLNSRIYALTKQIDTLRFQPLTTIQSTRQSVYHNNNDKTPKQVNSSININNYRNDVKNGIKNDGSPFSKKKTSDQSQDFINLLSDDDLCNKSRISYMSQISSIHSHFPYSQYSNEIRQNDIENRRQLQLKLQRSYKKINHLQEQLWRTRQQLNAKSNNININNNNNNKLAQSNIIVTFNNNNNNNNNNRKITLTELKQTKKNNQSQLQCRNLNEQFDNVQYHDNNNKDKMIRSQSVYLLDNSVDSIAKTQKKQPCFNQQQEDLIFSNKQVNKLSKLQSINCQLLREKQLLMKQINILTQQNKQLINQIDIIKSSSQQNHQHINHIKKLQSTITNLQQQIKLYQRNIDVMNKSQQLNQQSNIFNDQQCMILKKHNQFLMNENQKLSKACQKYMNEAKQSNKLKLQLTKIKAKIISEKLC